jgi:hypothetical protein
LLGRQKLVVARKGILVVALIFLLSLMLRLYYVQTWGNVPTSDPYHFVAWANGIDSSGHLDFPGSEDRAYGQYPDGYPMMLLVLSKVSGVPLVSLTKYLPILAGALCVLPTYLIFGRVIRSPIARAVGTSMVVFSLAFIKYTSVSIPNMVGLCLFALGMWLALGAGQSSKRLLVLTLVLIAAVAKIHYLSLVCLGVVVAIVVARKVMIATSGAGTQIDYRRILFLLLVAGVAGAVAWTAAYRIMLGVYGIDITLQPPPRLSQVLKIVGYPLIFGVLSTVALPLGIVSLAKAYFDLNFGKRPTRIRVDSVLLLSIWLVLFVFALGFLQVEYYPFRFNCYLMIPLGIISLLGILLVRDVLGARASVRLISNLILPATLLLVVLQPLVVSKISLSAGEPFLPWEQEYGESEMPVLKDWIRENTLSIEVNRSDGDALPRQQMIMADWVRSRAMRAFGVENVHLHWWFFQGWYDRERRPFAWRSLDVYGGNITDSLGILGRLNMRQATESTGEYYFYYKYLYTSDAIARVTQKDFGVETDIGKFDSYRGNLSYYYDRWTTTGAEDEIAPGGQKGGVEYPIRPFDKLYSGEGVSVYYFTPLKR